MNRFTIFAILVVIACAVGIVLSELAECIVEAFDKEAAFTDQQLDKSLSIDDRKRVIENLFTEAK